MDRKSKSTYFEFDSLGVKFYFVIFQDNDAAIIISSYFM